MKKLWIWSGSRVDIYLDFRDWWVGYYRAENYHYICLLPTLVLRVIRVVKGLPLSPGSPDDPYGTEGW